MGMSACSMRPAAVGRSAGEVDGIACLWGSVEFHSYLQMWRFGYEPFASAGQMKDLNDNGQRILDDSSRERTRPKWCNRKPKRAKGTTGRARFANLFAVDTLDRDAEFREAFDYAQGQDDNLLCQFIP